ncbi:unnamed protein product, partial [Nesidiocoris tenuis]
MWMYFDFRWILKFALPMRLPSWRNRRSYTIAPLVYGEDDWRSPHSGERTPPQPK